MWGSWKSPPHISLLLWARHLTSLLPFLHLWTSITTVLQDNYKARFGVFLVKRFEHEKLKMNRLMHFFWYYSEHAQKAPMKGRLLSVINSTPVSCTAKQAIGQQTRQQKFAHILQLHPSSVLSLSTAAITPVPAHHAKTTVRQLPSLWWTQRALKLLQFPGECLWMTKTEMLYCLRIPVPSLGLERLQKILGPSSSGHLLHKMWKQVSAFQLPVSPKVLNRITAGAFTN